MYHSRVSRRSCSLARIPSRPHDTAREVKLDVVDAVLDLLADGFHPAIGAVDLQRMTRGQAPTSGSGISEGEIVSAEMSENSARPVAERCRLIGLAGPQNAAREEDRE